MVTIVKSRNDPKYKIGEENEKIDVTGQESDTKAVKWVQEVGKEDEKKENKEQEVARGIIEDAKNKHFTYWRALLGELLRQMKTYDIPKGFLWNANMNDEGLLLWVKDPEGNRAAVGMKPSGEPKYDINWIDRRVHDALNLIDKLEDAKLNPQTKEGIILPHG